PDLETRASLVEAVALVVKEVRDHEALMSGVAKLREQIALQVDRLYGRRISADTEVTVTSGATEAIFAAIACAVHAGDEVIVLDPCYDCYEPAIALAGGKTVHV